MKDIKKILIIRFRRVGDAVISSVLCSSLKKTFPRAEIHYVLNESIAPLFEGHPDVDKLITFSEQEMKPLGNYLSKVRSVMRRNRYDIIIDTRSTIKTSWFCFYSLSTPLRIGKRKFYNILHNRRVDIEGITDEVTKTLNLLLPLEKEYEVNYQREFRLFLSPEEKENYSSYMEQKGMDLNKPVILCAVAARKTNAEHERMWDPQKMVEVLTNLISTYDVQLVFNYAGDYEKQVAYQVWEKMGTPSNVFIDIEAKGLRELMALCALSSFFFGNEGGPRHISQALNVPSLALYPPTTDMEEWLPNRSERFQGIDSKQQPGYREDMSYDEKYGLISVPVVWNRLKQMLDRYL